MKKFIRLISVICVIALLAGCGLVSKKEEPKKDVDAVITVGDIGYNMERFNLHLYNAQDELLKKEGFQQASEIPEGFWDLDTSEGKNALEVSKDAAIDNLVIDAIAYQMAKDEKIELTADELSAISNQMAYLKQDTVSLDQFKYMGVTVEELEEYYKDSFHIQHLIPILLEKGDIKIDEEAAMNEFESTYVKAKHILISTVDAQTGAALPDDQVAAANKKANEILAKINAGEDFDELMNTMSEDPGLATAPDGYVFTTGQMVPEFEEASFALKENQVSGLVKTSYGIHIIKRVPFDMEAEQEVAAIDAIRTSLAIPEFKTFVETKKKDYKIKIDKEALKNIKPLITNNQ